MGRPNKEITIHKCILENQASKVLSAISMLTEKDSLNGKDIQAIKILTEVYGSLINPIQEMSKLYQANYNSDHFQEPQ